MSDGVSKPLDGVRVIAFTGFLLGPAAAQYLADMGASVVKIEEPTTGPFERSWSGADTFVNGVSVLFMLAHRNVRSVAIDLKSSEGADIARRLCAEADVVVANFKPGVLERLGLGPDDLRRDNERLVYASASGFGEKSEVRHLPGQDLLLQAASGMLSVTGNLETGPVAAGSAIVDQHAASLLAMGILAALVQQRTTGRGTTVDLTMLHAALDLQLEPFTYHLNGGNISRPARPLGSTFHPAPYGIYAVADGHIVISLTPMSVLGAALGTPASFEPYLDLDLALSQRDAIYEVVAAVLRTRSRDELVASLRAAGVWCAPVNDYSQLLEDDIYTVSSPVESVRHPDAGEVRLLRPPVRFDGKYLTANAQAPRLGEHTAEELAVLGISPDEIEDLRSRGVIRVFVDDR